jgi:LmbE family N-acetylglucosaminyl deacetylase
MLRLAPLVKNRPLHVLCIGAHSDDLEIGCGATLLTWLNTYSKVEVTWAVLSAPTGRAEEARKSARALLRKAARVQLALGSFRDGFLPAHYVEVKEFFESLKSELKERGSDPDVVLTHRLEDRHQDHRLAAELTWNTWRDHLILEYEILKYEGDLGQPNTYVHVPSTLAQRKVAHLHRHFASQRSKAWFSAENFLGLMRLRGLECRAASGYAEAFHARKLVL